MTGKSIFCGSDKLIHSALGLDGSEHLKQKSACWKLTPQSDISTLVSDLYGQIEANWIGRIPSQANWRLERQTTLAPVNTSPEVVLERAIAILGERGRLSDWYNQIPVASGLIDHRVDKRAAVDLLRLHDDHADLVELKWRSDTPAFAAFEILEYGLAYLFCRNRLDEFEYSSKPLMKLNSISLQVLAPADFYSTYDLGFIADGIQEGLHRLCSEQGNGFEMSFEFRSFPPGFQLPFSSGEDFYRHLENPSASDKIRSLIDALDNIHPVWE